jgi:hypothetical protein
VQYIMKKFFPVPSRPVTIHYEKNWTKFCSHVHQTHSTKNTHDGALREGLMCQVTVYDTIVT